MSFLREDAVRPLLRWAETAAYGALTAAGIGWLWPDAGDPLWRWLAPLAVSALGFWFIRAAAVSALSAAKGAAPGVVLIDERRITYLGPHDGGFASLNEIRRIEIVRDRWVLTDSEGALIVPVAAEGAAALPDAFSALPRFSAGRALQALAAADPRPVTIWTRGAEDGAGGLALVDRAE